MLFPKLMVAVGVAGAFAVLPLVITFAVVIWVADFISRLDMAAAYSTIANYGRKVDRYLIERIEAADGSVIYEHEVAPVQVLDDALTAAAVGALKKVVSGGTGTRARIDRPQAGKTGTTQDGNDVWFVGFIPQYTTAVWVGHADGSVPMVKFTVFNDRNGEPQFHQRAWGGTVAAPIWRQYMEYVTADLPVAEFPEPPDGVAAYRVTPKAEVPDVLELKDEDEVRHAILQAGFNVEFLVIASEEPEGTILAQIPEAGEKLTQGRTVVVHVASGVPPLMFNLVGTSLDEVTAAIEAFNVESGLEISYTVSERETEDADMWGRIVATEPKAGQLLVYQQPIVVFVGVPPPPPPPGEDPPEE